MADYLIQDSTLDAIVEAINQKAGTQAAMTPAQMVTAIGNIPSGGGSGYDRKTGTFTLASNYTYGTAANVAYTGSILIATGLSKISAICMYSEEWANQTEQNNCWGSSVGFNNGISSDTDATHPIYYYSGWSYMKNGTNYYYGSQLPGFLFHSAVQPDIPEGSFGFKVYGAGFPIVAGHTIKWEAFGQA